jgi:acyl-CoA thioester hydrolase
MSNFNIEIPIQLRFVDLDMMGHVNNAKYLSFVEVSRIHYFKDVLGSSVDWKEKGIILARTEIDYLYPVGLYDDLYVRVACTELGVKSFVLSYQLLVKKGEKERIVANAATTMVCYDYINNKSIEMPQEWKSKISTFDNL